MKEESLCHELKNGGDWVSLVFLKSNIYALLWVIMPEECIVMLLYCVKMLTLPVLISLIKWLNFPSFFSPSIHSE